MNKLIVALPHCAHHTAPPSRLSSVVPEQALRQRVLGELSAAARKAAAEEELTRRAAEAAEASRIERKLAEWASECDQDSLPLPQYI